MPLVVLTTPAHQKCVQCVQMLFYKEQQFGPENMFAKPQYMDGDLHIASALIVNGSERERAHVFF